MKLAFLGPGNIGSGMVHRLLERGHDVTLWARSPERVQDLLAGGALWAGTPLEATAHADIVLSCLGSPQAVREVFITGGVLAAAHPGQTFVEHGTFPPELAVELSALALSRGGAFVDAPVSGGPEGARRGTLTLMIGGDAGVVEKIGPVLETYGNRLNHVGPVGSGQKLKMINQVLVAIHAAAAAEAATAVLSAGLDPLPAVDALKGGWAQSAMLERNLPRIFAADVADSGATIGGFADVLDEVAEYVDQLRVPMPLFDLARELFAVAVARGYGADDLSAVGRPDFRV